MVKIEKGIAIPRTIKDFPLVLMEIGDSFSFQKQEASLVTRAIQKGRW